MEKPSTATYIIRGITLLVIGFMVMLYTDSELKALTIVPGLVITAAGLVQAGFTYWVRKKLLQWQWYFIGGVAIMAIGIVLWLNPGMLIKMLTVGLGAWFFYQAAQDFMAIKPWRSAKNPNWWALALLGVVEVTLGLMLMLDPLGDALRDTAFIGVCMIFGGLMAFFVRYQLKRGDRLIAPDKAA
jgi:uncharacterized membrane protein HdeD (DUF308 family)